ncbi:MAG: hypothetical protein MJ198_08130 [Bacteroidales bacterium]|nr:hypothetical protein [Bacteroidales bacterium]
MKKLVLLILWVLFSLFSTAQIEIGLRDNSYARISYISTYNLGLCVEHSIFQEKRDFQYIRLLAVYKLEYKQSIAQVMPFGGRTYSGSFWNTGFFIDYSYLMLERIRFVGRFNCTYDSGLHEYVTYGLGGEVLLYDKIWATLGYGTIPEYREPEGRFRCGLLFKETNLSVNPVISLRLPWNVRNIRCLVSMNYEF